MQKTGGAWTMLVSAFFMAVAAGLPMLPAAASPLRPAVDAREPAPQHALDALLWPASGGAAQYLDQLNAMAAGAAAPEAIAACNANPMQACVFAEAIALQRQERDRDLIGVMVLVQVAATEGDPQLYADAAAMLRQLGPGGQVPLVRHIALMQAEAGLLSDAVATLDLLRDPVFQGEVLAQIVLRLAEDGHIAEAQEARHLIEDPGYRSLALSHIARAQARAGQIAEARSTAESIQDLGHQIAVLSQIAVAEGNAGFFDETLPVAYGIRDSGARAHAVVAIVTAMAQMGRHDEALATTENYLADRALHVRLPIGFVDAAFVEIARAQVQAGLYAEAVELADRYRLSPRSLVELLPEIERATADQGVFDAAVDAVRRRVGRVGQAAELGQAAGALARTGRVPEALSMARDMLLPVEQGVALVWLAPNLPD